MSFDGVHNFLSTHSNPHTVNWLGSSVWTPVIILSMYFIICLAVLPAYVQDKEPVQMTHFLIAYNAIILASNLCLCLYFTYYAVTGKFSPICQPIGGDDEILNVRLAQGFYAYFVSKFFELTDSVIILLRQKKSQTNCLHFYHHSSMLLIIWIGLRFLPGGSSVILAAINTFFHVITYLYFHLITFKLRGINMSSFKTVATISQIIQFCMGILHCITAAIKNCGYPRLVVIVMSIYISSFVILHFAKGFCRSYFNSTRQFGIFSDGPSPDRPRVAISSAEVQPEDGKNATNTTRKQGGVSDTDSIFLPQPAAMPSNTSRRNLKQALNQTAFNNSKAAEQHPPRIQGRTSSRDDNAINNMMAEDRQVISAVIGRFGEFLSRSPQPPVPEDPLERLVYNGGRQFGKKTKMRTKIL